MVPGANASCKWPNDVLADEKKLAGILVETPVPTRMVIGIGINVNSRAEDFDSQVSATSLRSLNGTPIDAALLLRETLNDFSSRARSLADNADSLPELWREFDGLRDRDVSIQLAGETVAGRAQGVNENGHLQLLSGEGLRTFASGTVRATGT